MVENNERTVVLNEKEYIKLVNEFNQRADRIKNLEDERDYLAGKLKSIEDRIVQLYFDIKGSM